MSDSVKIFSWAMFQINCSCLNLGKSELCALALHPKRPILFIQKQLRYLIKKLLLNRIGYWDKCRLFNYLFSFSLFGGRLSKGTGILETAL